MESKISLFSRARNAVKKHGFVTFFKLALSVSLERTINFKYSKYYIYGHDIHERNEADFLPGIKDFTVYTVTSNQQAEKMAAEGLDIYSGVDASRNRLDQGAIAICIFAGNKLAHIGWLGLDEKAKNSFDPHPYPVAFPQEACTGGTLTIPEFRSKGLMTYGYYLRFEYLRQRVIKKSRNIVGVSNIASQKAHEKFGPRKSRGYYLKFARWQFWREAKL